MKARMHDDLIQAGFSHEHFDEEFADYGGPESGPMIHFSPEYDVYEDHDCRMVFGKQGELLAVEVRDHAEEAMFEEMYGEYR